MAFPDELPVELVHQILIFAVLDNVDQRAAWVATLLRISRPICSLVQPLLVHTVVALDLDKLCAASAYPHLFVSTRNLVIGPKAASTAVASLSVRERLARAFYRVDGFRGPKYILEMLALDARFQPRVAVLSPSTQVVDNFFSETMTTLRHTTHLHVHVSLRYHGHFDLPDISGLQLTHLFLDLVYDSYFDTPLLGTIQLLLKCRFLQLLVVRRASMTARTAPGTFGLWRKLQSQGDHRLQLESEVWHDICLETSPRVFDRSLWTPSMSSFPPCWL